MLRLREGARVDVLDGEGRVAPARLEGTGSHAAMRLCFDPSEVLRVPRPQPEIVLYSCVLKAPRMDLLIEKVTELGVSRVVPLLSERVLVRLDGGQRRKRSDRWRRIAIGAAKQCGTAWVPVIDDAQALPDAEADWRARDLCLVGALRADAVPIRDALRSQAAQAAASAGLLIGPEGDFTEAEIAACIGAGAVPVSFGSLVLRAETAAMFALSVVRYELGPRSA